MALQASIFHGKVNLRSFFLNVLAFVFIYFTPALSHLLSFPLYLIEPMRIMIVLAMVHTNRQNAYILALTLPLFSFVMSFHPVFFKMLLITVELVLNVALFYFILKRTKRTFVAMLLSIVISKATYYLVKFLLISTMVLESGLVSTAIGIQLVTVLVFSVYAFIMYKRKQKLNS